MIEARTIHGWFLSAVEINAVSNEPACVVRVVAAASIIVNHAPLSIGRWSIRAVRSGREIGSCERPRPVKGKPTSVISAMDGYGGAHQLADPRPDWLRRIICIQHPLQWHALVVVIPIANRYRRKWPVPESREREVDRRNHPVLCSQNLVRGRGFAQNPSHRQGDFLP